MAIASFHLVAGRGLAVAGVPIDRRRLQPVPGLLDARVLGAGRNGKVHRSFDPRRRAIFAVWQRHDAFREFMGEHPVAARWQHADASWHVALRLVRGHGSWGGRPILDEIDPAEGLDRATDPVVVLTRASIRPGAWRAFDRASREVGRSLPAADGLRVVVGVGEAPVLRLGTVSVWSSADAAARSMTSWPAHAAAAGDAQELGWFSESLFATFAPIWSTGSWPGSSDGLL